jgi:hypothetical protein
VKKHVQFTRKNMSTLIVSLPGHPVSHSQIIPGLVLDRDLVHPVMMERWECSPQRRLRSVLVLDWNETACETEHCQPCLSIDILSDLDKVMERFSQHIEDTTRTLQAIGVDLVLCGGKVPMAARHRLREAGIIAVEMIAEDILRVLAECCATHPLENIDDVMRVDDPANTAMVWLSLSLTAVGSKQ